MTTTTSANGFLTTTQLDFQAYKTSLKTFLSQQEIFKDYDFEGPNFTVLIDLLAYNTYMNGTYLNLIGSEMFMDSSQLREAIVSHAKELNYTPRSRTSTSALVNIAVSGNNLPAVLTIPKNFKIAGRASNNQIFTFVTNEPINISAANNYTASNVAIYEGRIVREAYTANSTQRYLLQSANVDTSSIEVNVQAGVSDTSNTDWQKQTTLFGLSDQTEAFFVQGAEDFKYEVVFGNGVVGKALVDGNIVRINYRETKGPEANGVKTFTADQTIEGFSNVVISLATANVGASGGALHETDDSIKFNAPRFFATQERAITTGDFVTLVQTQFPNIEAITAYGGEEAEPKQYGKVIISLKVAGSDIVSNKLKNEVLKYLEERTALSIDPILIDPDFYHVGCTARVNYNLNSTTKTSTELSSIVRTAILAYGTNSLNDFGSDLRFSKLSAAIDSADPCIISNQPDLTIIKKLYPVLNIDANYNFNFGAPLDVDPDVQFAYPAGYDPVITTNSFSYTLGGTTYSAFIQDNGLGVLYIYAVDSNNDRVILNESIGTINYVTGVGSINALRVSGLTGSSLNIHARLRSLDIETSINKILLIASEDVSVTMTGIRV